MSNTGLTIRSTEIGKLLTADRNSAAFANNVLLEAFGSFSLTLIAACVLIGASMAMASPSMDVVTASIDAIAGGY